MKRNRNLSLEKWALLQPQRIRIMIAAVAGIALACSLGTSDLAYSAQAASSLLSKTGPAGASACTTPSFAGAVGYDPDIWAASVTLGDLNKDNNLDLVIGSATDSGVSWLPGNGHGAFGPYTVLNLGSDTLQVVVADFNKDSNPDIATALFSDSKVAVAPGNGAGGFGSPIYTESGGRGALEVADFNNDTKPDIVVNASEGVNVLLGNGSGGFGGFQHYSVGTYPQSVITGDFNKDGKPDVATANGNANDVSVLLGNGAGALGAATHFETGQYPLDVAGGDVNGDGNPDLVAANYYSQTVSVLLGNGMGSFATHQDYEVGDQPGESPNSVVIADFNGDAKPDIATANRGTDKVAVLLGNGAGSFGAPTQFAVGTDPLSLAAGDFNGDCSLDIATADLGAPGISVLLNECSGSGPCKPPPCNVEFSDVPEGSTFHPYIICLACRNVLGGYSDGTFRPGNDVTRGQLSKIISNAGGYNEQVSGQTFTDVPPGSPFYEFVERMASRGIIGGYGDGTFKPGNNATRGQISKIVSNAKGYNEAVSGQRFTDVPPGSTYYEFIERIASRGIIGGYGDGTFKPGNNASRGQVSKIVANAFFPDCQSQAHTKPR